jgi:hypothetical protein
MRSRIFIAMLLMAGLAYAREPRHYESGVLLQMDSAE